MTDKIEFFLDVEDGYPPISVERLTAYHIGGGQYKIMNTPFFVKELAYGDIVTVDRSPDGGLVFHECISQSSFKAISIILLDPEMDTVLMNLFKGHDCIIEYGEFGALRMVAVGIPSTADYPCMKSKLDSLENLGKLSYAELVG